MVQRNTNAMSKKPVVMISSTARDLTEYRSMVMDACLRVDTTPKMMEHLPPSDADAIEASLEMVDESDIYIGIFAHRYGYIPKGHDISITEMEYNQAVDSGIPILIFIIDDDVPVRPKDFERGEAAEKLDTLKGLLKQERVVAKFKSPEDLRGLVIHGLSKAKKQLQEKEEEPEDRGKVLAKSLHHTSAIPEKPQPFIAHPYTLLQVKGLIGRQKELGLLTDWITQPNYEEISIYNVVAIGGMGKSALTWHWFNEVAPQEKTWEGRIWWSFYETDATFDHFITKTLAYVSGKSLEEIKKLSPSEQQDTLFQILNNHPYLIVLDGLERILVAYASQNAAFINDDNDLDEETANRVAGAIGLPESGAKSFVGKHRLRKTTDTRIGHFLRKLSQVQKSKFLVSTRLYPADLQAVDGNPISRCFALFLPGLSDQDALDLWRAYRAKGSREAMLPVFQSFDKHPLLLKLLASEIAEFRDAPGDFDAWRKANPDFNVFGLPLVQVQSHVLTYALKGLSEAELRTLQVIAGFRMPASMMTLKALLFESGDNESGRNPVFTSETALDRALTILEDKGLLGWDRHSNRYDLHPIVRGVVWNNLDSDKRLEIHGSFKSHFEAMPVIEDYAQVDSIEDLRPAIELYNSLIEMQLYDEACDVFRSSLYNVFFRRFSANHLIVEFLERLFARENDQFPALGSKEEQSWVVYSLAMAYNLSGFPEKAISLFERVQEFLSSFNNHRDLGISLAMFSKSLRFSGQIFRAEYTAKKGLILARELNEYFPVLTNLGYLGQVIAFRGRHDDAKKILDLRLNLAVKRKSKQNECVSKAHLSLISILDGDSRFAQEKADEAWEIASVRKNERDIVSTAYYQGLASLRNNDFDTANKRLLFALKRVRAIQLVDLELQILIALAEFDLIQNDREKARDHLDEVWDYAEQGPFPLLYADALNVLAQIEIAEGNQEKAIDAATLAYQKAWCDGPPYTYHYGLENAKKLLKQLGAPEPDMPPFDPSKFEPMPEVEIDPEGLLD
ncbi:MAG: DUF4062 domain-containing protein [Cytophagales bacterium]|nr:DUF4062 domain-containing protein [Cytophagales bacterium]